ncbi:ABC transporter [Micromonospora sonchi]|uniref:ABC transporter n=1 Tax=Micromonospora sonchi TaxID=1763543 RepID=A0A917X2T3_9ACTN|nr:ABC transporter ATP-binding protein [Micromonospora sonchi]GGM57831.1 ABC transporter [Micromonospora sonchi]
MTDTPAVRVRGLRKTYGDTLAVDGVDLDVAAGEVVALLGPNGAGKTSTIEILEGHRDRDAGEVRVLGHDPARAGLDWRTGIGIVTQDGADLTELTVREAVRHFARYYPEPRDPDDAIELVGLTGKADARVRTLSGGQRRRLDVAIGVVGRPRLLFLDEPTTGFDPQARRQFWALIRRLAADEGCTILLSTHYLEEAEALADRVAVIVDGRIVAAGTPATLGGRATARTLVRWADGRQETDDPAALVASLTRRYGGVVPGLTISRPSLEDVYLDLIGDPS